MPLALIFLYVGYSVPWGHYYVKHIRPDLQPIVKTQEETKPRTEIYIFSDSSSAFQFKLAQTAGELIAPFASTLIIKFMYYASVGVIVTPSIFFQLFTKLYKNSLELIRKPAR